MNDIREIVEGYYSEIAINYKDDRPEFVYLIFANILDIFKFTQSFVVSLEVASGVNDEMAIATCFIRKYKQFLKLYSLYCQNYKM